MLVPPQVDWLGWAGRLNQASLLPFLAFLWTLRHIPDAPKRTVLGWHLYLLFVAVAIPAGIYSKTQLGTSMANVDWLHAPCEALLCLANLFIVLGLRDALAAANTAKEQQAADPDNAGAEGDSRTTGNSNSSKALRALPSRFDSSSSTQHSRNRLGYAAESRLRFGAAVQRRTIPAVVVHMPLRVLCSSSSGLSCLGTLRS